jgi:hypothetical protein
MATRAAIGVQHFVQRGLPLLVLIALVSVAPGRAEDKPPAWRANASEVARLGEAFKDEAISIRLPKGFAPLANNPPNSDEALKQAGVLVYGWTPTGEVPSLSSLGVYLLPPPRVAGETLDDFLAGFKKSVTSQMEDVSFDAQSGTFQGVEARRGILRGKLPDGEVQGVFLVFRDAKGTVAITGMRPVASTDEPTGAMLAAALLTFQRAK